MDRHKGTAADHSLEISMESFLHSYPPPSHYGIPHSDTSPSVNDCSYPTPGRNAPPHPDEQRLRNDCSYPTPSRNAPPHLDQQRLTNDGSYLPSNRYAPAQPDPRFRNGCSYPPPSRHSVPHPEPPPPVYDCSYPHPRSYGSPISDSQRLTNYPSYPSPSRYNVPRPETGPPVYDCSYPSPSRYFTPNRDPQPPRNDCLRSRSSIGSPSYAQSAPDFRDHPPQSLPNAQYFELQRSYAESTSYRCPPAYPMVTSNAFGENKDLLLYPDSNCPLHGSNRDEALQSQSYHMGSHTEDRPYRCRLCVKEFKTREQFCGHLRLHLKKHSEITPLKMRAHKFKHGMNRSSKVKRKAEANISQKIPHEEDNSKIAPQDINRGEKYCYNRGGRYYCKLCGKSDRRLKSIIIHLHEHRKIRGKPSSTEPDYKTKKRTPVETHSFKNVHMSGPVMEIQSYESPKDTKKTNSQKQIKKTEPSKETEKCGTPNVVTNRPFQCDICQKSFFSFTDLCAHKLTHRIRCEICDKFFWRKIELHGHMQVHRKVRKTRDGSLQCGTHQDTFVTSPHLHTHKLTHGFHCKICSKSFMRQIQLQGHMQVHRDVCKTGGK